MKFKFFCYVFIASTIFVSCSKDTIGTNLESTTRENAASQEILQSTPEDSKIEYDEGILTGKEIDTTLAIQKANEAMVSFVNSVDEYYESGMTYSELKTALDPDNSLSNITDNGNDLLYQAYEHLVNDTSDKDIEGKEIVGAMKYFLQYNYDNGVTEAENINWEEASEVIFGYTPPADIEGKEAGCKWYQIGCHLGAIWDFITGNNGFDIEDVLNIISLLGALEGFLD